MKTFDWDKLTEERKNAYKTVIKRRNNGETLESIARDYDVTRERIRQIVKKYTAP